MKTDTYTKIILTLIAVCLTFNVLKDLQIITSAQAAVQNLPIDVNIKSVNGQYIYNSIPVNIQNK